MLISMQQKIREEITFLEKKRAELQEDYRRAFRRLSAKAQDFSSATDIPIFRHKDLSPDIKLMEMIADSIEKVDSSIVNWKDFQLFVVENKEE